MQKIRWLLLILAILMALAVTFQNNDAVPVRLLWIERNMSLSILLACTTAIGFLAGALTTALMLLRRGPAKRVTDKKRVADKKRGELPPQIESE
ncbi:MAG: LapA family protein [Rubripirellula sp.]|nr:LapA family protein [Rubripirellula sp.]